MTRAVFYSVLAKFCNYSFSREQSSAIMKEQQRTPENRGIRMEQYKVILVDDEVEVIDVMKKDPLE